ncbi:hypothetical protein QYE76_011950 [Lolium multiflorum]|uniref:Retrotransposon gag domain-containing protein n=1 Tax=Lolium multiflorum TaxID=4521 RepID=A0AAD8X379_LOLMU|nr:hypothetical protein QYE76_011950 [Lolium multiflorum]
MATADENHAATSPKLDELMVKMGALTSWLQSVNETTSDLAKNTALLQLHAEDTASRLGLLESGVATRRESGKEPVTPMTTVVRIDADKQPQGRGSATTNRGQAFGGNHPPDPPPDHGTSRNTHHMFDREPDPEDSRAFRSTHHTQHRTSFTSTPKMYFPKFDGDDHQIWLDNCELYFEIYGVSPHMKVKFATLNIVSNAALWLKTVQKRQKFVHWEELATAVVARWGKSKHTFYMRQLLILSQSGTVDEYTAKFDT